MHPDPRFTLADENVLRAVVLGEGLVHLFAQTPVGPMVAHVPMTMTDDGNFRFHLARTNRIAPHLDGTRVIGSVLGPHGYVSPDWYADARNQVPTWNYIAVEIDGTVTELDRDALREQMEALAAYYESGLDPKPAWTVALLDPARREAMMDALCVFELTVGAMRGTAKLSQNKTEADRAGVHAALEAIGNDALAAMMAPS